MGKKMFIALLAALLIGALVLSGCPGPEPTPSPSPPPSSPTPTPSPQPDKVYELKAANFFPEVSATAQLLMLFDEEIEKRTDGRVKFTFYGGGSLLGPADMYDGVVDGIADTGWSYTTGYYGYRFRQLEANSLPLGCPNGWVATHVINDFYNEFQLKEFDQVHVIHFSSPSPGLPQTVKKPIYKLEDFKGLSLRAPGVIGEVVSALGGTPIPTPVPELYEALSKNVVNGYYLNLTVLNDWRFADLIRYVTLSTKIGDMNPFFLVMNKSVWESLPSDIQQIFNETAEEFVEKHCSYWLEQDEIGLNALIEADGQLIELTPEEEVRWEAAVKPIIEKYVADSVAEGYTEEEVRGWIEYSLARIDYWTTRQLELGIKSVVGPPEARP